MVDIGLNKSISFISLKNIKKEYLTRASFKKHSNLDSDGLSYLSAIPSLTKVSMDPKHLTILHTELAQKTADILYKEYSSPDSKRLFIELNPGVGRVSRKLLDKFKANDNNKLILYESAQRFKGFLDDIKNEYKENVDIYSYNAFNENLSNKMPGRHELFLKYAEFTKTHAPIIYGIKPWFSNAFVFGLFSGFIYESRFFYYLTGNNGNIAPEFMLYLPELDYARFNLNEEKKYFPFCCRYTVLARLFTKTEIVAEETVDHFFPYATTQHRNFSKYSVINQKKMYLIKMKFNSSEYLNERFPMLNDNKILFNTFLMQIFIRPSITLRDFIKLICKNPTDVFREANKYKGFVQGGYKPINTYHPLQFYAIFMTLVMNNHFIQSDISLAEKLNCRTNLKHTNVLPNRANDIRELNQDMRGQLILPDIITNYKPSRKEKEREKENKIEDRIFGIKQNKAFDHG